MIPAVSATDIGFAYGREPVIAELSLQIMEGDFFVIIGPNGSGKTTLLRLLLGSLGPRTGTIEIFGQPMKSFGRRALARCIALVPQSTAPVFPFTVEEIVSMGRAPHLGLLGFETASDRDQVKRAIASVGLVDLAGRPLDRLSGGEQQRVWIARALCQQPRLLLLDEPTASLDMGHQLQIMGLLSGLRRSQGLTVVMVSHDLNLAAMFATRMLLMHQGRGLCVGAPDAVLRPDHVRSAYGCEVLIDRHPQGEFPRLTLPMHGSHG
jgi:iron complex transport system ATP-binding protein